MDANFQKGYEYFRKNADAFVGAVDGAEYGMDMVDYVDSVQFEIDELERHINAFLGDNTPIKQLKGD